MNIKKGILMGKAAETRKIILQQAFELIYIKGYQSTSVDDILHKTGVTKGAFYYHFSNKDDMGLALINEMLKPVMQEQFVQAVEGSGDPIDTLYNMMEELLLRHPVLEMAYGCPVGNLAQETAPWNKEFNTALQELTDLWQQALEASIERGQEAGRVSEYIHPGQVSVFIISGYWGIRNLGKLYRERQVYESYLQELRRYLDTLK